VLFWLLIVAIIHRRDVARSSTPSPNPAKAPLWFFGPLEALVYADPYFAGTILYQWLIPGAILLMVLALWAAGISVLNKEKMIHWPVPRYRKIVWISLAMGGLFALPWLYAWIRVLCEPSLKTPGDSA
jgi:hypothetical protein